MATSHLKRDAGGILPMPGDLVGFSGVDLVSDLINLSTLGCPRWGLSHVALVTEHPRYGTCLVESTTKALRPCLVAKRTVAGVQIHRIGQRVEEYRGRVWHYPLRIPLGRPMASAWHAYLMELVESACPYDYIGAARSRSTLYAAICRWKHGQEDLRSLFCSELVAAAWKRFDVLDVENASGWNPNALVRAARRNDVVLPPCRWK